MRRSRSLPFAQGFPVGACRCARTRGQHDAAPSCSTRTVLFDLATDPRQRTPVDNPQESASARRSRSRATTRRPGLRAVRTGATAGRRMTAVRARSLVAQVHEEMRRRSPRRVSGHRGRHRDIAAVQRQRHARARAFGLPPKNGRFVDSIGYSVPGCRQPVYVDWAVARVVVESSALLHVLTPDTRVLDEPTINERPDDGVRTDHDGIRHFSG
jgi:hypothetical protein